jgi:hypothetical protein
MLDLNRWHSVLAAAKAAPATAQRALGRWGRETTQRARRLYALGWRWAYVTRFVVATWLSRWGGWSGWSGLTALVVASIVIAPTLESAVQGLGDKEHLSSLQQFLVTLGGALIGATAIAFSLVMFAMQINVDRMPHGLFRKLGSDRKLLTAFVSTFVLATGVASLSLAIEQTGVARTLAIAAWGTVLVLLLFLYAYRRALDLISPFEQLRIVTSSASADMRRWVARARRAEPLLSDALAANQDRYPDVAGQVDICRMMFFRANPGWTAGASEALQYAIAFARRFAERGDHDVAGAALNAVVAINASYVGAKGRTFFASNYLVDNPYTTDGFINDTLEHLRQNVQLGLSRGDERQVEETFRTLASLGRLYLNIDYASEGASKTHAQLAAVYLSSAVQAAVPHDVPDVLMEGLRCMSAVAQQMLLHSEATSIATSSEKIALVSAVGIARADHVAVTTCGVEQLAELALALTRTTSRRDNRFAIQEVRGDVFLLATLIVEQMRDAAPLASSHSIALAPFFSLTSEQAFASVLTKIANAVAEAAADNEQAQRVLGNLEHWADSLYDPYKQLLLAAIAKRSRLTFDLIHWASHITKLLLAVSNAPACGKHAQVNIRKSASWLISTLSWIPDDRDAVTYVEAFRLADVLFDASVDAHRRGCADVAEQAFKLLMDWGFKAGRYQTGWGSLETALCGAAALYALGVVSRSDLMTSLGAHLRRQDAPEQEIRFRAAQDLRRTAESLYQHRHASSSIDSALGNIDHEQLRPVLEDVAEVLFPEDGQQQ